MFKLTRHIEFCRATVTLVGTNKAITTHNSNAAINNAAGYLLRQYLLSYLKFRYETYKRIGHPSAINVSLAYGKVASFGNDLKKLVSWSRNNQEILHNILPTKRKTHYNESINILFPTRK